MLYASLGVSVLANKLRSTSPSLGDQAGLSPVPALRSGGVATAGKVQTLSMYTSNHRTSIPEFGSYRLPNMVCSPAWVVVTELRLLMVTQFVLQLPRGLALPNFRLCNWSWNINTVNTALDGPDSGPRAS